MSRRTFLVSLSRCPLVFSLALDGVADAIGTFLSKILRSFLSRRNFVHVTETRRGGKERRREEGEGLSSS
jgi:hypothetical protein